MVTLSKEQLLKIPEVIEEIKRHLWFESEKAGHDVGFEWAADDWINRYAQDWIDYHVPSMPKEVRTSRKRPAAQAVKPKKRRAKSYC